MVLIGERAKRARHSQVCSIENRGYIYILLRARERSERSEHTVVLSLRFLSMYIIVTKILRKIRATTFTERLRKITRGGPGAPGMSSAASN